MYILVVRCLIMYLCMSPMQCVYSQIFFDIFMSASGHNRLTACKKLI